MSPQIAVTRTSHVSPLMSSSGLALSAGLVAAGGFPAHAQLNRIELGIGGFLNEYAFLTNVDEDDNDERDFNEVATHFDGELHFAGKTVLDNGLEFGAQIEFEFPTNSDQVDEAFMTIAGGFGQLTLGGDNTAMYRMGLGTFESDIGVPINSGWVSDFSPPPAGATIAFRSPSVSTAIDITNDDNTFTYFSPRVGGFQFGASYVPNAGFGGNATNGTADTAGFTYTNGVSVAANYIEQFGDFDVGLSAGYATAFAGDGVEDLGGDDIEQIMLGGRVGFGQFKLSGSYANELDGRINNTGTVSTEGWSYIVGLQYEFDESLTLGVAYFESEVEGDPALNGDDEQRTASLGFEYVIGPGVLFAADLLYNEYDTEEGEESQAYALGAGFGLSF